MNSCCRISDGGQSSSEACPSCGQPGRSVGPITLKALLTSAALRRGISPASRTCLTADCPVVYFDNEASVTFDEGDLSVPVHAKRSEDPTIPVCYCFGVSRAMIEDEIRMSGVSTASGMIAAEVKVGHCACEVRNPKGACCLGDVRRVERTAEESLAPLEKVRS
jgi:hypothetical protein